MSYTSDGLKKEYRKETDFLRVKNLKRLREEIALLSLTDFSKETGITKNDISMLESGDKLLSLFHIQAYKKYFLDNYNIDLSSDYILGFTDIMENTNLIFQDKIGLSNDALEMLSIWKKDKETYNDFIPSIGKDIDILNTILEYQLHLYKKNNSKPNWSLFHFIGQYLTPHTMKREQQNRIRVSDGNKWEDLENDDILEKKNGSRIVIKNTTAINNITSSGTDTSKLHLVNEANNERYVIDINDMFKSYSKDNIFHQLDKIKEYVKSKERT